MSTILEIRDLSVEYESGQQVLRGTRLQLDSGQVYGLLGVNGAGKTTLLHTLCGVNRSFTGGFRILDMEITPEASEQQWLAAKKHRYFAADAPLLFDELTMRQYVEFIHKLYGVQLDRLDLLRMAEAFCCEQYLDRTISELSLGNRQKTVLMTGLLLRPPLFLLDEPLVGLDVEAIETFYTQLQEYCAGGGTVLFSSHLLEIVQRFCSHIFILHRGQIAASLPVDREQDLHSLFFGVVHNE